MANCNKNLRRSLLKSEVQIRFVGVSDDLLVANSSVCLMTTRLLSWRISFSMSSLSGLSSLTDRVVLLHESN